MKIERQGKKFNLSLDLAESLVLLCLVAEEKISININAFNFKEPEKIKKILAEFHRNAYELAKLKVPEEKDVKFFKQ